MRIRKSKGWGFVRKGGTLGVTGREDLRPQKRNLGVSEREERRPQGRNLSVTAREEPASRRMMRIRKSKAAPPP